MKRADRPFFYGATIEIFSRAKELRKNETPAEKDLWERLRGNQLGIRFYRQHPINKFIVDFYGHSKLLVIELDGGIHKKLEVAERDAGRESMLKDLGLNVIRFDNQDVLENIDKVIAEIKKHIN